MTIINQGNNHFPIQVKKYLTTKELAEHLSISESTLISYRANECDPAYKKIGRMVRYDINEVNSWIELENKKAKKEDKKDDSGPDNRHSFPSSSVITNNQ
jgi:predicted DNA-binding transcriptional regulator AlpA